MIQDNIRDYLMLGEGQNIEFKKDCQDINAIGKTVCGFLNTSGGYIVCGVDETGNIVGVDDSDSGAGNIVQVLQEKISPKALISVDTVDIEGKKVISIEVPAGKDLPYSFRDIFYLRKNNSTDKADIDIIRDMILRKQIEPERWERRFQQQIRVMIWT